MNEAIFEVRIQPNLLKFGFDQAKIQHNINAWLAISLFTEGILSSGKAGEILGITRIEFLDLLRKRGIAYLDYSEQELDEEFSAVNALEIDPAP